MEKRKSQMGHIYTKIKISNMERTRTTEVQALADTGATLTVIPEKLAQELELGEVTREMVRTGAGKIELQRAAARISIGDREAPQPVLISDFIDHVLVGAVTLEALALSLDPLTGKLKEEMLLLYGLELDGNRLQARVKESS
jgi:clan AA aspartic protease